MFDIMSDKQKFFPEDIRSPQPIISDKQSERDEFLAFFHSHRDIITLWESCRLLYDTSEASLNAFNKRCNKHGYKFSVMCPTPNWFVTSWTYQDGAPVSHHQVGRQLRKLKVAIHRQTGNLVILCFLTEKSAEVSTGLTATEAGETQEGTIQQLITSPLFDDVHHALVRAFLAEERVPLDVEAVAKVDGSSYNTLRVPKGTRQWDIWFEYLQVQKSGVIRDWLFHAMDNGEDLWAVISGQLLVLDDSAFLPAMVDILATSIGIDRKTLHNCAGKSPSELFIQWFPKHCDILRGIQVPCASDQCIVYLAEGVCPQQTTFTGHRIGGLCVSYMVPQYVVTSTRVFGSQADPMGQYIPIHRLQYQNMSPPPIEAPHINDTHWDIPVVPVRPSSRFPFRTPTVWKIRTNHQMTFIQWALQLHVEGWLTWADFLTLCPPMDGDTDVHHLEGFILLLQQLGSFDIPKCRTFKLKLTLWYNLHKYRQEKTEHAMEQVHPKWHNEFPIIGFLQNVKNGGMFQTVAQTVEQTIAWINKLTSRVVSTKEPEPQWKWTPQQWQHFSSKNSAGQWKILMNTHKEQLREIFQRDILLAGIAHQTVKAFINTIQPWDPEWPIRLHEHLYFGVDKPMQPIVQLMCTNAGLDIKCKK